MQRSRCEQVASPPMLPRSDDEEDTSRAWVRRLRPQMDVLRYLIKHIRVISWRTVVFCVCEIIAIKNHEERAARTESALPFFILRRWSKEWRRKNVWVAMGGFQGEGFVMLLLFLHIKDVRSLKGQGWRHCLHLISIPFHVCPAFDFEKVHRFPLWLILWLRPKNVLV